ncbi:MAG: hypothetical protein U5L00_13670 [Desulfovermiculus sp.]|nr:hypothetical protein [Desulfovermiculus sp.]
MVSYIDAMVMGNNEAEKREHVRPTYKKCKGFNVLQMIWEGYLDDSVPPPVTNSAILERVSNGWFDVC